MSPKSRHASIDFFRQGISMQSIQKIDVRSTVNELIAQHPETIATFNRFGIDTCCGGGEAIAEAARRDGADLDALLAALRVVVELR